MSKAYPSNLTCEQYEFLSDMIPEAKPGGRKREVDMWSVLNAIFYVLLEGVRWRSLPGDFPPWQTVYTYFRNWRKDGTWLQIHHSLREYTRIEAERYPSPSEAIIDSQSVKSAAMVSQEVGFDAGKKIKGRKRFMNVDTLGLVLRVLVTAASVPERSGGKQVLNRVRKMGDKVSRLTTIWTDGGFDGPTFIHDVGNGLLSLDCAGSATTRTKQGLPLAQKTLGGGAHFRLAHGLSPIGQGL